MAETTLFKRWGWQKPFYKRVFKEFDTERTEEIRLDAYYRWEQAGKPDNRELEFWLMAEQKWEQDYINKCWGLV